MSDEILLAAVATVCHRTTGQDDLVIGVLDIDPLHDGYQPEGCIWPTRMDLRDDPTGIELLTAARQALTFLQQHRSARLADIIALTPSGGVLDHHPLFQVVVGREPDLTSLRLGKPVMYDSFANGCDIAFLLGAEGLIVQANADLFLPATVRRLAAQVTVVCEGLINDHLVRISAVRLQSLADEQTQRAAFGHSEHFTVDACIHQQIAAQARLHPEAPALSDQHGTISYGELESRANRLARYLITFGVGPDVLVGILLPRSKDAVVALLAILKAGGAYVPLDPNHPHERLSYTLRDAATTVLISDSSLVASLGNIPGNLVLLDRDAAVVATMSDRVPVVATRSEHLAYVIYTSGSTGQPKGVPITHAQVVRLFLSMRPWFALTNTDVWTVFHSFAFDYSVWETWGALLHGARLVVVSDNQLRSPDAFRKLVADESVTVLSQTPLAFAQFVRSDEHAASSLSALRYVILGGERLDLTSLSTWFARHGDAKPCLINLYGITETAVISTCHPLSAADLVRNQTSPIGRALADSPIYLLDRELRPVPVGVIGELFIGGDAVGRGYLNRPELTTERFIPDPFRPGQRMYRSGDAARLLPDGDIDYIGRLDQQVKIRGYRIELSEIETVLRRHQAIMDCAVIVYQPTSDSASRMLVAYVVPRVEEQTTSTLISEWLRFAKALLPTHMVPSQFLTLASLPMTVNGKLDRRGLPTPPLAAADTANHIAPASGAERLITDAWKQVLGEHPISVDDNFFDIGGNSLRLMQVHSLIQQASGCELPIVDLFQFPTVRTLAKRLGDDATSITPATTAIAERARRQQQALTARRRTRTDRDHT